MDWNTLPSPLVQPKLNGKVSPFLGIESALENKLFLSE
nr:MAG TPA: hypothetical protein [Caudoviricetes sp.]